MSQDNHNEPDPGSAADAAAPQGPSHQGPAQPSGPQPPWGAQPQQQPQWGQPPQWGQQPQWGQTPYGQNPYGQPAWGQGGQPAPQLPPGPYGQAPGQYTAPPKPGVIPLRPLGLGEILDGAFQACRRNPAATFGTALLIQGVITVLSLLFTQSLLGTLSGLDLDAELTDAQALSLGTSALSGGTALMILSVVGICVMQGLLVIPMARAILNLRTGFGQTWRLSKASLLRLAGLSLLLFAAAAVGITIFIFSVVFVVDLLGSSGILLTVLGVLGLTAVFLWLSVKLALAPAALVLEPRGVFAAIGRSWALTRRNWWRTCGILLLTTLIVSIITSVISMPITMLITLFASFGAPETAANDFAAMTPVLFLTSAVSAFFGAIGYAFQATVTSLLYIDLRMRQEGFDVALMKDQELVGSVAPDTVPGRATGPGPAAGQGPWPGGPSNGSA
ncbi:glycerophosphoryl diester phosphodiesterase membrane domain-containing protein [Arthrobacter sp.]|uniref:glycerophosphoryl diester phosphodiesterase membrane domain-containing protein n=1 Tax=Arthrobacter sp. TaxID=1667 RepID=UPI00289D3830|nr:glycerophosphoryl diester phosphodiesterase membrane domain-containing protein [Arthrobacter sp.]